MVVVLLLVVLTAVVLLAVALRGVVYSRRKGISLDVRGAVAFLVLAT